MYVINYCDDESKLQLWAGGVFDLLSYICALRVLDRVDDGRDKDRELILIKKKKRTPTRLTIHCTPLKSNQINI